MRKLFIATVLTLLAATPVSESVAQGILSGRALINELSKGGYVIYMRHTKTDRTQKDSDLSDLSDCSTQRNLNDEGERQAAFIARAFQQFEIRFDEVFSSPYCRAVDTATIMFGHTKQIDDLRYLTRLGPDAAAEASRWLNEKLAEPTDHFTNRILIAHTANLRKATGIWPKNAGDINVFNPRGDGTYTHVGTILVDEWALLLGQR